MSIAEIMVTQETLIDLFIPCAILTKVTRSLCRIYQNQVVNYYHGLRLLENKKLLTSSSMLAEFVIMPRIFDIFEFLEKPCIDNISATTTI